MLYFLLGGSAAEVVHRGLQLNNDGAINNDKQVNKMNGKQDSLELGFFV